MAFFFPLWLISCEEEPTTEEVTLSRMFRPVSLIENINGTEVSLSWTSIADAIFSLELSQDSLLFTTNVQQFTIEDDNYIELDLVSMTRYSARVKSISKSGVSADSGWKEITFVTGQ